MKKIKLKKLDEVIYTDTCENGLQIYVWVNKKINTFQGTYVVNTGAEDVVFTIGKEKIHVPFGTHHYLEHMMCKMKDGSSLLDEFNKRGCYSNASTYPNRTIFEFVGSNNFNENLDLLLDAISNPTFNEEYFASERGPILEEARMRKDDVGRISLYGINECLFKAYPNRVTGLGNIEDIKKMKLENIKKVYDTFYHPKNSFVIVTGNVDPVSVIHQVKENQSKKTFSKYLFPIKENYKESKKIVKKEETKYANIETPRVYLSVKIPLSKLNMDEILLLDILNVVLNANFGVTSLFREELLEQNLIVTLGSCAYVEREYLIIQISSKTKYPKEVLPFLKEKLEHLDISWEDIKRKIKSEIATLVLGYEDPENVNSLLSYCLVHFGKVIEDEKVILESITKDQVESVLSKISLKEKNVFYLNPKKDD